MIAATLRELAPALFWLSALVGVVGAVGLWLQARERKLNDMSHWQPPREQERPWETGFMR